MSESHGINLRLDGPLIESKNARGPTSMKRLRKFALTLDRDAWSIDDAYAFYLQSRAMCNFVDRALAHTPVALVDSSKLVIRGALRKDVGVAMSAENVAVLQVPFPTRKYSKAQGDEQATAAFICSYAMQSLELLKGASRGPIRKIISWIEEFRDAGFVNRWCHQQKTNNAKGITARLDCQMDSRSFELYLHVIVGGREVVRRRILRTDPDELAFHYRLPEMKLTVSRLVVTGWQGKSMYVKNLKDFR
jgi:hypothetical protein